MGLILLVSLAFSLGKHLKRTVNIRRVFIIQFVTASHREQFEVLLELYIDPGTS